MNSSLRDPSTTPVTRCSDPAIHKQVEIEIATFSLKLSLSPVHLPYV